jgi:hypothetical protein
MDLLVGLVLVAAALALLRAWGRATSSPPARPPAGPSTLTRPASSEEDGTTREIEALVDGLVVGHFLTRDHYEDRLAAAEHDLEAREVDPHRWDEACVGEDPQASNGDDPVDDFLGLDGSDPLLEAPWSNDGSGFDDGSCFDDGSGFDDEMDDEY